MPLWSSPSSTQQRGHYWNLKRWWINFPHLIYWQNNIISYDTKISPHLTKKSIYLNLRIWTIFINLDYQQALSVPMASDSESDLCSSSSTIHPLPIPLSLIQQHCQSLLPSFASYWLSHMLTMLISLLCDCNTRSLSPVKWINCEIYKINKI